MRISRELLHQSVWTTLTERYYLGQITEEAELAPLEEHLLACAECVERAEETAEYVDATRQGIILGDFEF